MWGAYAARLNCVGDFVPEYFCWTHPQPKGALHPTNLGYIWEVLVFNIGCFFIFYPHCWTKAALYLHALSLVALIAQSPRPIEVSIVLKSCSAAFVVKFDDLQQGDFFHNLDPFLKVEYLLLFIKSTNRYYHFRFLLLFRLICFAGLRQFIFIKRNRSRPSTKRYYIMIFVCFFFVNMNCFRVLVFGKQLRSTFYLLVIAQRISYRFHHLCFFAHASSIDGHWCITGRLKY